MFINLYAKLICTDGIGGQVVGVVLNPERNYMTQLVVRRHWLDMVESLVALHHVTKITAERVTIALSSKQLNTLPKRFEIKPLLLTLPDTNAWFGEPPALTDSMVMTQSLLVPRYMIAVERGTPVYALDGFAGRIAAYKIDPRSYEIINVSVDIGRWWNRQRVQLLPYMVTGYHNDTAYLPMSKQQLWMRTYRPVPA